MNEGRKAELVRFDEIRVEGERERERGVRRGRRRRGGGRRRARNKVMSSSSFPSLPIDPISLFHLPAHDLFQPRKASAYTPLPS